jgi:hypothetical protein
VPGAKALRRRRFNHFALRRQADGTRRKFLSMPSAF